MSTPPAIDASPQNGPLSARYRSVTIATMAAVAMVSYNNLAVAAALPDVGRDLGSVGSLPLVITVELLAASIATLGFGPLVDTFGVRAIFRLSLVSFMAASVACALAPSLSLLIAARAVQGLFTGGVLGSAITSIGLVYEPEVRARVYAVNSTVWGTMGVAGPGIAALLIARFDWRSVFAVIVPVGLLAIALGWSSLPGRLESDEPGATGSARDGFDLRGLGLVSIVTIALLVAASEPSWWAASALAGAALFWTLYRLHARRTPSPVVKIEHLEGRRWRYIHASSTLAVAGGTGAGVFLPIYLNGARGLSTELAAFSVLFTAAGWSTASWVASRLMDRRGAVYTIIQGSRVLAAGSAAAALAAIFVAPVGVLLACFFIIGTGIGTVTTAGLALLQYRAEASEMGRVSAAHQFLRSLGFAYGAALGGLVLLAVVATRLDNIETVRELLGGGGVDNVDPAAASALRVGFAWSQAAMAVLAGLTVVTATLLARSSDDPPGPDA